jgi:hypothetical protein
MLLRACIWWLTNTKKAQLAHFLTRPFCPVRNFLHLTRKCISAARLACVSLGLARGETDPDGSGQCGNGRCRTTITTSMKEKEPHWGFQNWTYWWNGQYRVFREDSYICLVCICLGYVLDDLGSIPGRATYVSLRHRVQTGCGALTASYPMGIVGSVHGVRRLGRETDFISICRRR